jgi:hypothetical protein
MTVSPSRSTVEPAAAINSDGFSCFLSKKMIGRIDAYHIEAPGV